MKLISCKQGTPEWLTARCGLPTASEFGDIVTPMFKAREGATRHSYLCRKLAERIMGVPLDMGANSFSMEQGKVLEDEAIPWYSFQHEIAVERVGLCTNDEGTVGCSPDGLIGEAGGIEIKCPEVQTHVNYLLKGKVPPQYLAQVHGGMFVTGRKWWKFVSYNRWLMEKGISNLVITVERDERIQEAIAEAMESFLKDLDSATERITGKAWKQKAGAT